MITVRELIMKLLDFNLDATVNISTLYEESDINLSWTNHGECGDILESKKFAEHVFLETDGASMDCENEGG